MGDAELVRKHVELLVGVGVEMYLVDGEGMGAAELVVSILENSLLGLLKVRHSCEPYLSDVAGEDAGYQRILCLVVVGLDGEVVGPVGGNDVLGAVLDDGAGESEFVGLAYFVSCNHK